MTATQCDGESKAKSKSEGFASRERERVWDTDFLNDHCLNLRDVVTIDPARSLNFWGHLAEDTWKVEFHRLPRTINHSAAVGIRTFLGQYLDCKKTG